MAVPVTVIAAPGPPPSFDLHGPLTEQDLDAALAALPPCTPTLRRHTADHHTLVLPPPPFPAGTLVDLLAAPLPEPAVPAAGQGGLPAQGPVFGVRRGRARDAAGTPGPVPAPVPAAPAALTAPAALAVPASPLQRDLLLDALAAPPGAGLHVGQLHWRWHGPLDTGRFTAAWRSLAEREAVLRAALAPPVRDDGPRVAVHPYAVPEVRHHAHGSTDWAGLAAAERARGFDLRRPSPLRVALLGEAPGPDGEPATRVLITYHQALLDPHGVRLLLGAFYRAYLAGGRLPGGDRRPDVRDHLQWLRARDLGPARTFWYHAAPPPGAATLPARPAARPTGQRGRGTARQVLTPAEADRLREWAARWGAAESTALHAAWALQLYRAAVGPDAPPRPVAFAVTVSGRGIGLPGAERLPAPLRNPQPVHVVVDPAAGVSRLLADLSGRALDAAAYEWVSAGQIGAWAGHDPYEAGPTESLLVFEPPPVPGTPQPGPAAADRAELAAEGVRIDDAEAEGPLGGVPFSLTARHSADGSLVLDAVHDRGRLSDGAAAQVLAQTAALLRELPSTADGSTTVAEALGLLAGTRVPPAAVPAPAAHRLLRRSAHPGAGTVFLVPPPGAPEDCYAPLACLYRGPEALATLDAPAGAAELLTALRPALATGEPLLIGCHAGAGAVALEAAGRIAAHGWYPPLVVVAGTADGTPGSARALAEALATATARRSAG
ncbi:condensation domain-containing protein [Streptomyces sp. NPDC012888]|uniref:condensation domain-containing protein n=1 Tax=Streptomyces sp. NPDC012888 TaxID=3364855 RepID=UPI00367CE415